MTPSPTDAPQDRPDEDGQDQGGQDQPAETGARPGEILRDGVDEGAISDEEAVLAYNANAEDGDPDASEEDQTPDSGTLR
jgi:hypothetical protein